LPLHPIGKLAQFSEPFHDFRFEFADREPVRTTVPFRVVGGFSGSHPPRVHTTNFELNLWGLRNISLKAGTQLSCAHGAGVIPRFHSRDECLYSIRTGARLVNQKRKFRKGLGLAKVRIWLCQFERVKQEEEPAIQAGRVSQWGRAREGAKPHLECAGGQLSYSDGTWGALENLKSLNPSAEPTSP
jgi:hypothetical protein